MEARAFRLHLGLMHPLGLFHQHGSRISCDLRKAAAASRPIAHGSDLDGT